MKRAAAGGERNGKRSRIQENPRTIIRGTAIKGKEYEHDIGEHRQYFFSQMEIKQSVLSLAYEIQDPIVRDDVRKRLSDYFNALQLSD